MKFCPRCGAKVSEDEANCIRCGKDLLSVRKLLYREPENAEKDRLKPDANDRAKIESRDTVCSFCGTIVHGGEIRCKQCGTEVKPSARYSCPYCGMQLNFIEDYQRWYCFRCRVYV